MSDCIDCGKCYWTGCDKDSLYTIRGVTIKRAGSHLYVDDVDLCAGHFKWTEATGHLNLDWARLERVMAQ